MSIAKVIALIKMFGGGGSVDPQDIAQAVADWCDENITEDPTVVIDKSLQTSGAAADSLITGSAVKQLQDMLASIGENMNMFNVLTAQKNGRLSDSGVFVSASGYFTSDFIPIKYGRTYTKNSPSEDAYHRYSLYTSASEEGYIADSSGTSNSITIGNVNAKYIRFCGALSEIGTTYFNTFTPSAIDTTIRYMADCMEKQLRSDIVSIGENINLFDIVPAKKNGRLNESGVFVEVDDYFTSDFIPVESGKIYYKNSPAQDGYHRYALYSSASESGYISGSASNSNTIEINNATAHYLRFSGLISEIGTARLYTGIASANDKVARQSKDKIEYYAPVIDETYDASHWFKESPVPVTANEHGYVDSSGSVQSISASYYYSDMISVSPGERYRIKGSGVGSSAYYWCLYKDGTKVRISDAGSGSSSAIDHEFYITIPFGVNQMRTCWFGASTNCEVYKRNPLPLSENEKSISILFVGNSLTQDGIAYLPYVLKHYYPEVNFKFYMWYIGGATLAEHYNRFDDNIAADLFSVAENSEKWTNYSMTRTMSTVLSTYKFDIVCLQEYFNNRNGYTDSDLADFNDCRDYIVENYTGGNALEFITLFHAPKRENTDGIFSVEKTGNGLILQKTITQDMIPNGIAVYRALSTDLDALGDQGHLSPDGVHAQEGLPCLLQTYVTLCWLFEKLAINKSVYGCPFRMTTAIYNTLNVPGPNLGTGVITGTDAQNILAQEVAIKAYKEGKKFVIDNLMPQ